MKGLVESSAPANIALIKYMGKLDEASALPANASLSFTLENIRTFVQIEKTDSAQDDWQVLKRADLLPMELSENGLRKFLKHFNFLKLEMGLTGNFLIRSANNFPSDCGLASSASSFAALTKATHELRKALLPGSALIGDQQLARFSRRGSGSSIRSFAGPWVEWRGEDYAQVELPQRDILHSVVVVENSKKEVSSSDAHLKVVASLLFKGRVERAELRLSQLLKAMQSSRWREAYEICWAEFWDMHALFETSQPPFGYMSAESLKVLRLVQDIWKSGDGPIATMDAGANVHLLYRADQAHLRSLVSQDLGAWTQVI